MSKIYADNSQSIGNFAGKTIVVILPDGAERYLPTAQFEGS